MITARYSIWNHKSERERMGTPAKVARVIRQTVEDTPAGELPRYDWVIAHVWSWFKKSPGADENAEDMAQENAAEQGGERGYAPVLWCAERISPSIRAISPEEMIWRIRMKHSPVQTRELIQAMPREFRRQLPRISSTASPAATWSRTTDTMTRAPSMQALP